MLGSDSKQVDALYQGIIEYYRSSGLSITASELSKRDKIVNAHGIVVPDSLDKTVIDYQTKFLENEGDIDKQTEIIKKVLDII